MSWRPSADFASTLFSHTTLRQMNNLRVLCAVREGGQGLDAVFEKYVARATEIELETWRKRGWWHKLKDNAFYALNEVL